MRLKFGWCLKSNRFRCAARGFRGVVVYYAVGLCVSRLFDYAGKKIGGIGMGINGEKMMREKNEFEDRPIERSIIVLGLTFGASLYGLVALVAIDLFMKGSGQ